MAANVGGWAWLGVDRRAVGRVQVAASGCRSMVAAGLLSMIARSRRLRICDTFADCVTNRSMPQRPQNAIMTDFGKVSRCYARAVLGIILAIP